MNDFNLKAILIYFAFFCVIKVILRNRANIFDRAFPILNFIFFILAFYYNQGSGLDYHLIYFLLFTLVQYFLIILNLRNQKFFWVNFLFPICILIVEKISSPLGIVGVSYLCFRTSFIAVEIKNQLVSKVKFSDYFLYVFYLPISFLGPITPFGDFVHDTRSTGKPNGNWEKIEPFKRLLFGVVKYKVAASFFQQLTFKQLWFDGYEHGLLDFFICSVFYYLYMFFNFSGFCDIVISTSKILGFRVKENFDNPFIAHNLQNYWNRWHITLSAYMRDVFFTPFAKILMLKFGPRYNTIIIPFSVFCTFVLTGIWHGFHLNFLLWGAFHGVGLAVVSLYGVFMKRNFKMIYKKIYNSRPYAFASTALTFIYVSVSFFFFELNFNEMTLVIEDLTSSF